MTKQKQSGFTLIELMIVVAIIGILAAIAVPQYQTYTKKAKFTEVVNASSSRKASVEVCLLDPTLTPATDCTKNKNGIPDDDKVGFGNVQSIEVLDGGTIRVTAKAALDSATFIMVPKVVSGNVTWDKSTSSCLSIGLC